jgi:hypothetical protein
MSSKKKIEQTPKNTRKNNNSEDSQDLQKISDEIKNISETKEILVYEGMFDNRVLPCEIVSGSDAEAFKYEKEEIEEFYENLEKISHLPD